MEAIEKLVPLLAGIVVFVTVVLGLLSVTSDAFIQWREQEKRTRRASLEVWDASAVAPVRSRGDAP